MAASPIALLTPELNLKVHEARMRRPPELEHVVANDGSAVAAQARGLDNMPLPQVFQAKSIARRLSFGSHGGAFRVAISF
jgi:hypothetical protein